MKRRHVQMKESASASGLMLRRKLPTQKHDWGQSSLPFRPRRVKTYGRTKTQPEHLAVTARHRQLAASLGLPDASTGAERSCGDCSNWRRISPSPVRVGISNSICARCRRSLENSETSVTGSDCHGCTHRSGVECVEALTIVLAIGSVRGWRSALGGSGIALILLLAIVAAVGPALARIPIGIVQIHGRDSFAAVWHALAAEGDLACRRRGPPAR
jgi:hypothetical protein